ncbi:hypothetical protein MycrhDRAFT_2221 [Mycolicibacterium rhodesiae JS60]|nr:hypothetical protein MycrhDRAFT_2221 [Mycolicibacterium rhodesiae JS60]
MEGVREQSSAPARAVLPAMLAVLFATGWAANHFTTLLPVLARSEGLGRAALTGVFWAVTYPGFGLPVVLVTIEPGVGITAPMIVLSAAATAVAVLRAMTAKHAAAQTMPERADPAAPTH